jgi:antitoxin CptB
MLNKNLKKLTYRLRYRGIKELDIFCEKIIALIDQFSMEELDVLERLINEEENNIYNWILGNKPRPIQYQEIIKKLLT